MTIDELKLARESEDKVEFKEAKGGNYSYNGGSKPSPKERRHCILGYVVALANEEGGCLVFGMSDKYPHNVVGTNQALGECGMLEQKIYNDIKIRVSITELYEAEKRVLVIHVPSRPIGKVYKFEDVPLMRVGEELHPMSDEQYFKIIQEQEVDFSQKINKDITINDLDSVAIQKMKDAYVEKTKNKRFYSLPDEQALIDLNLIKSPKEVTNAALLLLGRIESIRKYIPQAGIFLEYRNAKGSITFDDRKFFQGAYFIVIDEVWDAINLRNGKVPVQKGAFIFDIPFFNREVIREALNNAVGHRDYSKSGEIVIKQSPNHLEIINPGGFPLGVSIKNLLTVTSTPRNRLLTEVMAKTGIVERSGQGVDKIFYQCLSEAKPDPDYTASDDFQVELRLSAVVEDKAFSLFIRQVQNERDSARKDQLSVQEIITLNKIRKNEPKANVDKSIAQKLLNEGLIEKIGKTNMQTYCLSKDYYSFINEGGQYTNIANGTNDHARVLIMNHLEEFGQAGMSDFVSFLGKFMSRDQIKRLVYKMVEQGTLEQHKANRATIYRLSRMAIEGKAFINRAIHIGIEEMRKRGEFRLDT